MMKRLGPRLIRARTEAVRLTFERILRWDERASSPLLRPSPSLSVVHHTPHAYFLVIPPMYIHLPQVSTLSNPTPRTSHSESLKCVIRT